MDGRVKPGHDDLIVVVFGDADENVAFAGVVGGGDDAFFFHLLDQRGGAVVADAEVALDEARAGFAFAGDEGDGLVEEALVAVAGGGDAGESGVGAVIVGFGGAVGDFVVVGGLGLGAEEVDDLLDLAVADERGRGRGRCGRRPACGGGRPCRGAVRRPARRGWCGCRTC